MMMDCYSTFQNVVVLDPYVKARGGETVLHWACQSKEKNERLVDELLRWVLLTVCDFYNIMSTTPK